jgi:hypothetical protein
MKQILHIFAKDLRRFWPEILVSLATLGVVMYSAHHWLMHPLPFPVINMESSVPALLSVLVAVAWWLLIARVIHAERLVGDTQSWLTRPYNWRSLLAAKLLFLAVFLYLPLIVAQSALLISVKLNPLASLQGMLFNLVFVTAILVLPAVAIATVTPNLLSMLLTVLGVVLGVGTLVSTHKESERLASILSSSSPSLPIGDDLGIALLLMALYVIVILLQYALRRVWLSRILLFGTPIALAILFAAAPKMLFSRLLWPSSDSVPSSAEINRTYPPFAAGATAPIRLAYGLDEHHPIHVNKQADTVEVQIPLALSGMAEGTTFSYDELLVTFEAGDGSHWSIARPNIVRPGLILADNKAREADFNMPIAEYEKLKSSPSTVTITLLLTQLQETKVTRIPMPTQDAPLPDLGACVMSGTMLYCRTAFRPPQFTRITPEWVEAPCTARTANFEQQGWLGIIGNFDSEPAEFGIVPAHLSVGGIYQQYTDSTGKSQLCTAAFVTFTQYRKAGRMQVGITVPNFQFPTLPQHAK